MSDKIDPVKAEVESKTYIENPLYVKVRDELNEVGTGMCLAKWTQVTLQLQVDIIIRVTTPKLIKFQKLK